MNRSFRFAAFILALLFNGILFSQDIEKLSCSKKISVLENKAFFLFPDSAFNSAMEGNLMAADPNPEQETRIMWIQGDMKLVFYAQELYMTADKTLLAEVKKLNDKYGDVSKQLTDKDSILSVLSTPTAFDSLQQGVLINSLYVKTQDNTLFRISAYISPEAFSKKNEFIRLSEKVFASISKGSRVYNRKAHEEKVALFGSKTGLTFKLPADYYITTNQKYDFQVMNIHKFTSLSDTNWISIVLYCGNHPSPFYSEYGLNINSAKKSPGKFLSQKFEWMLFQVTGKNIYLQEQQVPADDFDKGMIFHMALMSNQESSVKDLAKLLEEVKIKKE